ncbi:MAG: Ldh family oxidoreductase [Alphaproteobacteria bacterium]|nr:Ldh family oxidoreductase [Alphaproteobacteria bacterium]
MKRFSAELLGRQLTAIFTAWGMPADHVDQTVRAMLYADLSGIDSHGISMMALYQQHRKAGKLVMAPKIDVVQDGPVTALIDGGGGLGHAPGTMAMNRAIEKCMQLGLAAVGVRNSNHFGAAGYYAKLAADRGVIGMATTSGWKESIVPTFGAKPMFPTNPIAFAVPAGHNRPFVLDMATSTAAIGKFTLARRHGRKVPKDWALAPGGKPSTDPQVGLDHRLLTPLGGTREMGSHKGYGLAAMVEILSTVLTGGSYSPTRRQRYGDAAPFNVGHFFMTIHPAAFRPKVEFAADMDHLIDALYGTPRADRRQPVLVAGDPEETARREGTKRGIPLPDDLVALLTDIAGDCRAENLLKPASRRRKA